MGKMNEWLKRGLNENADTREDSIFSRTPAFEEVQHSEQKKTAQPQPQLQQASFSARPYQNVVVYRPKSESDIEILIDFLKRREPAIVDLGNTDAATSQRMLDFLSGAVYALSGKVHNISGKIYLLTPEGIDITVPAEHI